jgi:hypothetical protein
MGQPPILDTVAVYRRMPCLRDDLVTKHQRRGLPYADRLSPPASAIPSSLVAALAGTYDSRANTKLLGRSYLCHCEERSDEAISIPRLGDCFARKDIQAVPSNDCAFALPAVPFSLVGSHRIHYIEFSTVSLGRLPCASGME